MAVVKKTPADYDAAIQQLSLTGTDFNLVQAEWISGSHVHLLPILPPPPFH